MYLKRGSKIIGPFTIEKITDGLRSGQLNTNDLASTSQKGPWEPLSSTLAQKKDSKIESLKTAEEREPSEFWILFTDLWQGIRQRLAELKDERQYAKETRRREVTRSNGLFSGVIGKSLIAAVGVAAVAYLFFGRSSPEQAFKDQILDPIRQRIARNAAFVGMHKYTYRETDFAAPRALIGKTVEVWEKKKYEADLSYDIKKSNSLVSPYIAHLHLDLREYCEDGNPSDPHGLGRHRTRESVISAGWDEETVDINIRQMSPFTYVYKYGTWTFMPTEYMKKYCGADHPGPWPIVERRLYEETLDGWEPLVP